MKEQSAPTELCIKCGKEPIHIKKRGLGRKCYNALVRTLRRAHTSLKSTGCDDGVIEFERHLQFAAAFLGTRPFLYRPARFRLGGSRSHTPSFYDVERDTWVDVVCTRQAYHIAKGHYEALRLRYPHLKFELRRPDGSVYGGGDEPADHAEVETLQGAAR